MESVIWEMQNLWQSCFCFKYSKFIVVFKNAAKNCAKVFCFSDNYIWIGIVKLSLLRTGYISSIGNVLTTSAKIWHVKKGDFFQLTWLGSDQFIWWRCCDEDFNSGSARLQCCLSKGPHKRDFLDIYVTTFSEVSNFGNTKSLRFIFFTKYLKFILDFENVAKKWENFFCFGDNCIWIGTVKLSLVRTGCFSSAANVLTSSPKIWHVKNRDFFQLNWLGSDQWIW